MTQTEIRLRREQASMGFYETVIIKCNLEMSLHDHPFNNHDKIYWCKDTEGPGASFMFFLGSKEGL